MHLFPSADGAIVRASGSRTKGRDRDQSQCKKHARESAQDAHKNNRGGYSVSSMREVEIRDFKQSRGPHMKTARGHKECKYTEGASKQRGAWPAQAMNILCKVKQESTETTHVVIMQAQTIPKPQIGYKHLKYEVDEILKPHYRQKGVDEHTTPRSK